MSIGVGDAGFRQKSSAKMRELIDDENCTVLIVSHDMNTLRKCAIACCGCRMV